ncbi:MAG: inositol monophosphatase [Chitinophagales bacterium]|nr:MAG: inositol monophosphatase [Chitinophagales bacterium]
MQLETLCLKTNAIVLETGAFIRAQASRLEEIEIEEKAANNLVSNVDRHAEEQLVARLSELIPGSGLITEEQTENITGKTWEWIIDPLDGTTNFLYGIPFFSISVGLRHNGLVVAGAVYEVMRNELFYAWKGGGAYLNGKKIAVSSRSSLRGSLLATGFPFHDFSLIQPYMQVFSYLMQNTRGLRRLGSAALDLAYVGCGRFDGFFEYSLNPWDVAAGTIIIQEAGGVVTDFSGGSNYLFGREIIASNPHIADQLRNIIQQTFKQTRE